MKIQETEKLTVCGLCGYTEEVSSLDLLLEGFDDTFDKVYNSVSHSLTCPEFYNELQKPFNEATRKGVKNNLWLQTLDEIE